MTLPPAVKLTLPVVAMLPAFSVTLPLALPLIVPEPLLTAALNRISPPVVVSVTAPVPLAVTTAPRVSVPLALEADRAVGRGGDGPRRLHCSRVGHADVAAGFADARDVQRHGVVERHVAAAAVGRLEGADGVDAAERCAAAELVVKVPPAPTRPPDSAILPLLVNATLPDPVATLPEIIMLLVLLTVIVPAPTSLTPRTFSVAAVLVRLTLPAVSVALKLVTVLLAFSVVPVVELVVSTLPWMKPAAFSLTAAAVEADVAAG